MLCSQNRVVRVLLVVDTDSKRCVHQPTAAVCDVVRAPGQQLERAKGVTATQRSRGKCV